MLAETTVWTNSSVRHQPIAGGCVLLSRRTSRSPRLLPKRLRRTKPVERVRTVRNRQRPGGDGGRANGHRLGTVSGMEGADASREALVGAVVHRTQALEEQWRLRIDTRLDFILDELRSWTVGEECQFAGCEFMASSDLADAILDAVRMAADGIEAAALDQGRSPGTPFDGRLEEGIRDAIDEVVSTHIEVEVDGPVFADAAIVCSPGCVGPPCDCPTVLEWIRHRAATLNPEYATGIEDEAARRASRGKLGHGNPTESFMKQAYRYCLAEARRRARTQQKVIDQFAPLVATTQGFQPADRSEGFLVGLPAELEMPNADWGEVWSRMGASEWLDSNAVGRSVWEILESDPSRWLPRWAIDEQRGPYIAVVVSVTAAAIAARADDSSVASRQSLLANRLKGACGNERVRATRAAKQLLPLLETAVARAEQYF